jgi:chorismate mutase
MAMGTSVRALRGATTVEVDEAGAIAERTLELLSEMVERNALDGGDVISILFTATPDLVAAFPATAARHSGFSEVPLMCAQEIAVPGSLPRCVRVMMHVETDRPRESLSHVYLHEARSLRDDLDA